MTRSCYAVLAGHRGVGWCVAAWSGGAASGSADHTLRLWALPAPGSGGGCGAVTAARRVLRGHRGAVRAVAAAGPRLVSASADGTLRVWAAGSGACLRWISVLGGGGTGPADPVVGAVRCLAVWGGQVLGGCSDGAVRAWDVETLEEAADGPAGVSGGGPGRAMVADAEAGAVWCAVGRGAAVWRRGRDAGAGAVAGE